jgi:hypothetical protein
LFKGYGLKAKGSRLRAEEADWMTGKIKTTCIVMAGFLAFIALGCVPSAELYIGLITQTKAVSI